MANNEQEARNTTAQGLTVHNIYTKDVSFESPNTPQIFTLPWEPKVDFDLAINSNSIDEDIWESVLDVTVKVSVKIAADKQAEFANKEFETAFIAEVKMAGIFTIAGFAKEQVDKILATAVPTILFPYVREAIASLVVKGGFPSLLLPPMNFDAMYQQHLAENNAKSPVELN